MNYFEALEDFDFSVEETLASYADIDIQEAKDLTKNMTLSDYMAVVNALDVDNETEITRILDKYLSTEETVESFHFFESEPKMLELDALHENFFSFVKNATIKQISESTIFSKYDITNTSFLKNFTPSLVQEALDLTENMEITEVFNSVKMFVNENTNYNQARDIFIMKYVVENILDHKTKTEISKITKKPMNTIKTPSYTDPVKNIKNDIVSADSKTGMIATKDQQGNVSIIDTKDPNATKQIAVEEIQRLKQLAGVK